MSFDTDTIARIDDALEVVIETSRLDGRRRRTIIWAVVDGEDVFVRSVNGERGYWFQAATEPDADIALVVDGHRLPVSATLATDADSIERTSRQLERKYAGDPDLASMLEPSVLPATLLLEPAAAD
jgi:hypothetical protein